MVESVAHSSSSISSNTIASDNDNNDFIVTSDGLNVSTAGADSSISRLPLAWYYGATFIAGFVAFICVGAWFYYLKSFLGSAAYAQTSTWAIILLGVAFGSSVCSRQSIKLQRPLLFFIIAQTIIAFVAIYFHNIFIAIKQWATGFVLPQIDSPLSDNWFKVGVALVLIFPQAILLGVTLPLMATGLARLLPNQASRIISLSYFSYFLGAATGIAVGGFVLILLAGLPAVTVAAGLISFLGATVVWVLGHRFDDSASALLATKKVDANISRLRALVMTAAIITGVSVSIYEVVWLRWLSSLLGASSYTFNILLTVFIVGLGIGALLAKGGRRWWQNPLGVVAVIQIAMGCFALLSLIILPLLYPWLQLIVEIIARREQGYFELAAVYVAMGVVITLPVAIFAGMTLPLLTKKLLIFDGEEAIGQVYTLSVLGALVGVFITLHILLPQIGISQSLIVGALLNMGLGVVFIGVLSSSTSQLSASFCFVLVVLVGALLFGQTNPRLTQDGVFRRFDDDSLQVLYYKEGKTASVSVLEKEDYRLLRRDGKLYASLYGGTKDNLFTRDEVSRVILGLLPLLFRPDAKRALNIGFGNGLTNRTLLLSNNLKRLDNIEIEPRVIEGASYLGNRIQSIFEDSRYNIIYDDAKTILSQNQKYDVVVSQPPAFWLSDVTSLLSAEFYRQVSDSMTPEAIFFQWLPLYDMDPRAFSSIVLALTKNFQNFHLYAVDNRNVILAATNKEDFPPMLNAIFANDSARSFLSRYFFHTTADIQALFVGAKDYLLPYFESFQAIANSYYHPVLGNRSFYAFFRHFEYQLIPVFSLPVPVRETLNGRSYNTKDVTASTYSQLMWQSYRVQSAYDARYEQDSLVQKTLAKISVLTCPIENTTSGDDDKDIQADEQEIKKAAANDESGEIATTNEVSPTTVVVKKRKEAIFSQDTKQDKNYLVAISELVSFFMPFADKKKMTEVWSILAQDDCLATLLVNNDTLEGLYAQFWRALSLHEWETIKTVGHKLLPYASINDPSGQVLLLSVIASYYQQGDYEQVFKIGQNLPTIRSPAFRHAFQLIITNAASRLAPDTNEAETET